MAVPSSSILHVAGNSVINRIQSANLQGDVPTEKIREVGNREVVDIVPGDLDSTWSVETFDVSTEFEAWLSGAEPGAGVGSAASPGFDDPEGTEYSFIDMAGRMINIPAPWKLDKSGAVGTVGAGHLLPAQSLTRISYRFGTTDNATQSADLAGGAFYYALFAPVEQIEEGDGATKVFVTDDSVIHHRVGGPGSTNYRSVFGVLVDGVGQLEGADYTVTGGGAGPTGAPATITFSEAPDNGADVRFCYFSAAAKAYPQSVHKSALVLPAAVRGRDIEIYLEDVLVGGVQSVEIEGTVEGEVTRQMGTAEPIDRSVTGTDVTGTVTIRSRDIDTFFNTLSEVTGVDRSEVFGYLNQENRDLKVKIKHPKTGAVLKTLWVPEATFKVPSTPAQVNTDTDFPFAFDSATGDFVAVKGDKV